MRKIFFIKDTLENKISYCHLAFFLAMLPLDAFYSEIVLISFGFHTLIHVRKSHLYLLVSKPVLLMASLYLVTLAGVLYSYNKQQAMVEISNQIPFILLPVLLALTNIDLEKYSMNLLKIFGFTCVIIVLLLFINALQIIIYFNLPVSSLFKNEFINQNFSQPFSLHATFFAIYVAFSLIIFLFYFINERSFSYKIFYSICLFILLAGLIQLSSKSVFIAVLCIVFFAFPFVVLNKKARLRFILLATCITFILLFIITQIGSFNERFITQLKEDLSKPSLSNAIKEPRITRWKAELHLIQKSPLIGYGTGSEKTALRQAYFSNKLFYCYLNEFNAHSQYLAFLITLGITGFSVYLCILLYGLYIAVKTKDIFFMSTLVLIAVVSATEDIMTFSRGRMFYSFFIAFFLLMHREKKSIRHLPAKATTA